jgi:hypothetical protein
MKKHSLLLVVLCLFWFWDAKADECSLSSDSKSFVSLKLMECRVLTDETKSQGKALTARQLEQARSELVEKENSGTIWGDARIKDIHRKVDCMMSTGDFKTCTCLNDELPFWLHYIDYVALITAAPSISASQLGLSDPEFSKLTGIVWSVRDQCIAQ